MQPESALNRWDQWSAKLGSRPVILGTLNGGRSNHSFLLDSDIGKLVLRINGTGSLLPGADRSNEISIWKAAAQQHIAPPLLFGDPQNQYLVSTYIHNELPSHPQLNPTYVDQALTLLDRCHQLKINTSTINYFSHIEHYWQIIEARGNSSNPTLIKQRESMQSTLKNLINSNTPTGLCHHDPVIANFVGSPDRLYLVDWEYAANGLQIMDYAALATEWQLDDSTVLTRTGCKPESLTMAKALYEYLCSLWEEAKT